jgi:hypothetical protein
MEVERHFPLLPDEAILADLGYEMGPPPHEESDPIGTGRNGKRYRSSRAPGIQLVDFTKRLGAGPELTAKWRIGCR